MFDARLAEQCEKMENAFFDHDNRLALLKSGDFKPTEQNSIIALLIEEARKKDLKPGRFAKLKRVHREKKKE